jgi:hypothetical protein
MSEAEHGDAFLDEATEIREAAEVSLEHVKQWANSAYANGSPPGRSSRAARASPADPAKVTF